MYEPAFGNILTTRAVGIVIPVNTVGVPGKGLAKQAADLVPGWEEDYKASCDFLEVGSVSLYWLDKSTVFISLPTKRHWRDPSKLEWIAAGLDATIKACEAENIPTIAIPMLGCGCGELIWADVRALIRERFDKTAVKAYIYGPLT